MWISLSCILCSVIEVLVNGGRQIDAVHFVHAFELTERFPPVPLLKTYLKDLRRNSQGKGGNMGGAGGGLGDANAQELAALKAVIRCVEEYKLEADYALDPLQKRVAQLEKSKADKKRMGEAGKYQQPKKQRANGGFHGFRGSASGGAAAGRQAPPVFSERAAYTVERYPYAGPGPGPNTFDYPFPVKQLIFSKLMIKDHTSIPKMTGFLHLLTMLLHQIMGVTWAAGCSLHTNHTCNLHILAS
ncbi:FRIGIDA-like protein 3 [Vitis vinifera]|uniref:FRIGIDA-like protein n=1 Tax=Vitis vinifera TaxID=29760 RepID=A0A438KRG8_VITVI|nr:FRIGIDA-like protein 3 [Vitis vinifera]